MEYLSLLRAFSLTACSSILRLFRSFSPTAPLQHTSRKRGPAYSSLEDLSMLKLASRHSLRPETLILMLEPELLPALKQTPISFPMNSIQFSEGVLTILTILMLPTGARSTYSHGTPKSIFKALTKSRKNSKKPETKSRRGSTRQATGSRPRLRLGSRKTPWKSPVTLSPHFRSRASKKQVWR